MSEMTSSGVKERQVCFRHLRKHNSSNAENAEEALSTMFLRPRDLELVLNAPCLKVFF